MRIHFFLENKWLGNGSANSKATNKPLLVVDLALVPDSSHMEIDGQWYTSKYQPSYHYEEADPIRDGIRYGILDHVDIIIRPNGGEGELKWHRNQAPFQSENKS